MNRTNLIFVLFFCFCVGPTTGLQAAHPYHLSLTEIELNPKTGNFEVSMCLWPADVERALRIQEKRPIDLDEIANLDALLQTYVGKRFTVRVGNIQLEKIRWVGHETNNRQTWLYFEIKSPSDNDQTGSKITIENRLFFELNDDQLNQVNFRASEESQSFTCQHGKSQFELKGVRPL